MTGLSRLLIIKRSDLSRLSVIVLILANLVPLYGVIFLGWKVFLLMMLFWTENVIIGFFNVLKMLLCKPDQPQVWLGKLAAIPFFCIHYGIFTMVHGVFVFFVFGGWMEGGPSFPNLSVIADDIGRFQIIWGILALFLSHMISFIVNYIGKGEYKKRDLNQLVTEPYTRVVILHITIIVGAFLMAILGGPIGGLILLIALKTLVDVLAHLKQHNKPISSPEEAQLKAS